MFNKKTNKKNSQVLNELSIEDNKLLDNSESNVNLSSLNDDNFKEALNLYNAINEGKIDLNPKEKNELLNELNLILNHFESSSDVNTSNYGEIISKNMDIGKDSNQNFNKNTDFNNDFSSKDNLIEHEDFDEPADIEFEKKFPIDEVTNDVAVNEKDLIRDEEESVEADLIIEEETFDVVNDDINNSLSVDDVLKDLVGEDNSVESGEDLFIVDGGVGEDKIIGDEVDGGVGEDKIIGDEVDGGVGEDVGNVLSVDDALNDLIDDYSNEVAIKVNNISMEFKVSKDKIDTLKEYFIRTVTGNKPNSEIITALENVSFEIPKGNRVGIIGFNGAGKSTLLKVLSGVYDPTEGVVETNGRIAPLLELGAGFDPNYTGKDNIFLNGAFLGYSEDFLKEKYDEILEFSELGEAINYHVKSYSSGMRAKLGFAIATIVEPDILILDEILSVGDIRFRKKSADKIRSLINSGITVLLVSHSVSQIRDLCNKAIWIDEGKLKMYGEVNEVCDAYVKAASNATKNQLENIQLN